MAPRNTMIPGRNESTLEIGENNRAFVLKNQTGRDVFVYGYTLTYNARAKKALINIPSTGETPLAPNVPIENIGTLDTAQTSIFYIDEMQVKDSREFVIGVDTRNCFGPLEIADVALSFLCRFD